MAASPPCRPRRLVADGAVFEYGAAHQLVRTRNWVVIYFGREGGPEHQRTVVTETRGPLEGWRVVRGREAACREHYFGTV